MRYMFLIYADENAPGPEPGSPEFEQGMAAWYDFDAEARAAGVWESGEPLHPTAAATTVSVRDGDTVTTDGPFAETTEQLGGYYILDCADLDEAVRWAAKIPTAYTGGKIEVRPVMDMPAFPDPRKTKAQTA